MGSDGEAGRHPVAVVKVAMVEGEGGEENEPVLKVDFHLNQRALLNCTRPLRTDTTQPSQETFADCTTREQSHCWSRSWCLVMPHHISG